MIKMPMKDSFTAFKASAFRLLALQLSARRNLFFALGFSLLFFLSGGEMQLEKELLAAAPDNFSLARRAVVHVQSTLFRYSYKDPWKQPYISRSSGTGFIVEGQRILTNAHVVSGANTVRLKRVDQNTEYEAELVHIAHDCDLALLSVSDKRFFEGAEPLTIGELPMLNSPVEVIGFPIGGDRVSITRGIVSRIDMSVYSHSGIDYHLNIQVDAAINPGNSGGPAMQGGRLIGVAFQALSAGENLGYLIPPQIVKRFLADIEDGRYDGYTEFGVMSLETLPSGLQKALGLERHLQRPYTGVLVHGLIPGSSADGYLQPGDVLFKINGKKITERGDVNIGGSLQNYNQLVDNLYMDDLIKVEILRKNKVMSLSFPSRITHVFDSRRRRYENPPSYTIKGGLLFQPLDGDLMRNYRSYWLSAGRSKIVFCYDYFFLNRIYKERSEDVVLTRRLADKINLYADEFLHHLVKTVNGKKIRGFAHFTQLLQRAQKKEPYLVIGFHKLPYPMVLKSKDLKAARTRIFQRYGIKKAQFVGPNFQKNKAES